MWEWWLISLGLSRVLLLLLSISPATLVPFEVLGAQQISPPSWATTGESWFHSARITANPVNLATISRGLWFSSGWLAFTYGIKMLIFSSLLIKMLVLFRSNDNETIHPKPSWSIFYSLGEWILRFGWHSKLRKTKVIALPLSTLLRKWWVKMLETAHRVLCHHCLRYSLHRGNAAAERLGEIYCFIQYSIC